MASWQAKLGIAALLGAGGMLALKEFREISSPPTEAAAARPQVASSTATAGFREFQFGMSETQLGRIVELEVVRTTENSSRELHAMNPIQVGSDLFDLSFRVGPRGLDVIRLTEEKAESFIPICDMLRESRTVALSKKYGQPVGEPSKISLIGSLITTVNFPGTTGMGVSITSVFIIDPKHFESGDNARLPVNLLSGNCSISIAYNDQTEVDDGF